MVRRFIPSICLDAPDDKLIIDYKVYADAFLRHLDRQKFISGHLYQLYTYLKNEARVAECEQARGMLL